VRQALVLSPMQLWGNEVYLDILENMEEYFKSEINIFGAE
jgi:hypothetical protein